MKIVHHMIYPMCDISEYDYAHLSKDQLFLNRHIRYFLLYLY